MRVVLLFGGREEHGRLSGALAGAATVVSPATLADARPELEHRETRVVVVCVEARAASRSLGAVREIHRAFPGLTIVAYCDLRELERQVLVTIVRSGVTDLIFRGLDDGQAVARHVLAHAVRRTHALELLDALAPQLPEALRSYVEYGLQHPTAADTLDETAASLSLARRTLTKRLSRLGAPSPRRFFTWTRLLLASALLTDPGRSLQSVALELQLDSGTSLRHLLRRYAGIERIGDVSRSGLRSRLLTSFVTELEGTSPSPSVAGTGTSRSAPRSGSRDE